MAANELLESVIKVLEQIMESTDTGEISVRAEREPDGFLPALTFIVYDHDGQRSGCRITYEMIQYSAIDILPIIARKLNKPEN